MDAFTRASRALHASLREQPRAQKELAAVRAGDPLVETTPRRSPAADPPKPELDRMELRMKVRGHVLKLTDPDSFEEEECERIYNESYQRLYESDRYDALLDLPLEEAVEAICKDLGVRPKYELWEGTGWPAWRQNRPALDPPPGSAPPGTADRRLEDDLADTGVPPHPPPYGDTR
jgi:hypothetical protein